MSPRSNVTEFIDSNEYEKIACPPKVTSYYAENTFSEEIMKSMISSTTFDAFKTWQENGVVISKAQADEIANAMKEWALSKGATAYTHWFQPMTGLTAEKHDSFLSVNDTGRVLEKFSGTKLIQGEPDASSFPSGGIRATFEARGYTAWDPSSPAFITEVERGMTLTIPTIFISYTGEALDKKLPLLRSDKAINEAAKELLALFGNTTVKKVYSTCGPEQEYFLVDKGYARLRPDLLLCGRTLVGASSPKGQQLEDQYFGSIKDRILNYMNDAEHEAYKLGIPVVTRHNEVAPHQYEFAPYFESSNLAADHNQLLMDIMKKTAARHGLECLLHEKPFAGINGSGKHLNWSLADNLGNNLLNPGDTPEESLLFLTVFVSVIKAVYDHADLLRASVACAGNEHRLGANEAPPAIVSVFIGEQLTKILSTIEKGEKKKISKKDIVNLGIGHLPTFIRDTTDRNRTSTFAFTGSKFEFRAVGSSMNISTSIAVINTIVADAMLDICSRIRKGAKGGDFDSAVMRVLAEVIKESKKILFEGNNYADEWVAEAAKRGLPNIPSTAEALKAFVVPQNIKLFEKHKVFNKVELKARYTIWLDLYEKVLDIEARTLCEMATTLVLPAAYAYQTEIGTNIQLLESMNVADKIIKDRQGLFNKLTNGIFEANILLEEIQKVLEKAHGLDEEKRAAFFYDSLKPLMEKLRGEIDVLEGIIPDEIWELPKYREMLFIS